MKIILYVLVVITSKVYSQKTLPSYIKPCSLNDPKLTECVIKHGNAAIPHVLKGDKSYGIPSFMPLKIDKIVFNAGALKLTLTNAEVTGFESVRIIDGSFNKDEGKINIVLDVPRIDIKSDYQTKGKILLLPFEGSGAQHMTLLRAQFTVNAYLDNFSHDSKDPIILKKSTISYIAEDSKYNFENLFNGNKELGDRINQVLNENHPSLYKEFHPVVAETINTITFSILKGIINNIYFKDIFLP